MDYNVRHNEAAHQFEFTLGSDRAVLVYSDEEGVMDIVHTEVPPSMGGKGVGKALVRHALAWAMDNNRKVRPTCWFVQDYFDAHPELRGLLDK